MADLDNSLDLVDQNADMKHGIRLGLKMAADFLSQFDPLSSHKYRLGDCLLAKFGVIEKSEIRFNRNCGMDQVIRVVARELQTTPAAILSRGRTQGISRARHLCAYLASRVLEIGPNETAAALGQHHTSILNGIRKGRKLHTGMGRSWRQIVDKIIADIEG